MDAENLSEQEQENLAGKVLEDIGVSKDSGVDSDEDSSPKETNNDPLYVQKRLKQQQRKHERELQALNSKIDSMQQQSYSSPQNSNANQISHPSEMDEIIHRAISSAFEQKELQERKAKEAEHAAHVSKKYDSLVNHLDSVANKYDDFDDVVRGDKVPFTANMRDAALFLPQSGPGSAGETLYKLGKNPDELHRISKLHPVDQVSEMVKLSHALSNGVKEGEKSSSQYQPMNSIKTQPNISTHVNDKTSISVLRQKMKNNWK